MGDKADAKNACELEAGGHHYRPEGASAENVMLDFVGSITG